MTNLKNPENFCQFLWHEYLENQNYAMLGECFVPETSVIGTGEHEVSANLAEFENKIAAEIQGRNVIFKIEEQWYQTQSISEDCVIVIGELRVKEQSGNPLEFESRFRFTFVLQRREGQWKVLHVHHSVPDPEQGADEFFPHRLMEQSNRQLIQLVEEKTKALEESYRQMEYNAHHDSLTQLLNRRSVEAQISEVMQKEPTGVMVMLDVDNFKQINDTYGHPAGDQALETLGEAIQKIFPQGLNGRIGGDEFIVYQIQGQKSQAELRDELESLQHLWDQIRAEKGLELPVTVSSGIALFPQHGQRFDQLWSHADQALYQAKAEGRQRLCFWEEED
ncbi:diguanylate cyclase domain-containing protein [Holdemania massiliensis]|uniref:diguanylate cyclase domain-containing protein n=1 Tax=Holdemania massiliensis TaxID=1468449 RepID=UPI00267499E7|nr:diguanylate cyclase [Holdemania massiliensis]